MMEPRDPRPQTGSRYRVVQAPVDPPHRPTGWYPGGTHAPRPGRERAAARARIARPRDVLSSRYGTVYTLVSWLVISEGGRRAVQYNTIQCSSKELSTAKLLYSSIWAWRTTSHATPPLLLAKMRRLGPTPRQRRPVHWGRSRWCAVAPATRMVMLAQEGLSTHNVHVQWLQLQCTHVAVLYGFD
jgi:hypothetical protein